MTSERLLFMSHDFIWKKEKIVGFDVEIPIFEDSKRVADSVILAGGPHINLKYLEELTVFVANMGYQPVLVGFPGHAGTHSIVINSYVFLSDLITKFLNSKFARFPRLVVGHSLGCWLANTFISENVQSKIDFKLVHFCIPLNFTNEQIDQAVERVSLESNEVVKLKKLLTHYFADKILRVEVDESSMSSSYDYFITSESISKSLESALKKTSDYIFVFGNQDIMSPPTPKYKKYSHVVHSGHFPMLESRYEVQEILKKVLM